MSQKALRLTLDRVSSATCLRVRMEAFHAARIVSYLRSFQALGELWLLFLHPKAVPNHGWDSFINFIKALSSHKISLRKLVLASSTRPLSSLGRGSGEEILDLSSFFALKYLFCSITFLVPQTYSVPSRSSVLYRRLPPELETLSVVYGELESVTYIIPEGKQRLEDGEGWPRWLGDVADAKIRGDLLCLRSITVYELDGWIWLLTSGLGPPKSMGQSFSRHWATLRLHRHLQNRTINS